MPLPRCAFALVLAAAGAWLSAQEPVTPPPPPAETTPPPPTEPAPAAQPEAPGEPRSGRRRGQGRDQRQELELPEFTPVPAPPLAGLDGKQSFWFTMYPDVVVQYDPVTDTVARQVRLRHGMFWDTTLTHDRKRLLVVTDQQRRIEVVDLASCTVVDDHLFAEDGYVLRIRSVREVAGGVCWLVRIDRVKKEPDRYSFEPSQWLLYDSQKHTIVRRVARLPEAMDRRLRLSADGTCWLGQDDEGDLLFLDARKLTELGRIDLHTPRFFGAGPLRLMGDDLLDGRDPKRAHVLFSSTDPVEKNRTQWGMVELDLEHRRIVEVHEWGPQAASWGLQVAPKKRIGAVMSWNFGGGREGRENRDTRSRLALYDLRTGARLAEVYEQFRPRRGLVAIAPDADKVYVGIAGNDFEVFDAQLQRLKTVELDGEISGEIHVVDG